jgi:hypothetical protein
MISTQPGPNVIKLFTSPIYNFFRKKLECLSLAGFFQPNLMFESKA